MAVPETTIRDQYSDAEIAANYGSGFWQRSSFYELAASNADAHPERTFVFDSTSSYSYGSFRDEALRLAVGLWRRGVKRGDRVAVQLPNWTEFPLLTAALSRIGAITVPIMPIYRHDEVRYVLRHSGAVAAVTCDEHRGFNHRQMFEDLLPECPELEQVLVARPAADLGASTALDRLRADGNRDALEREAGADSSPDDGFLIVYTSGTTSRPKGCYHSFNTLRASAAAIAKSVRYDQGDVQFGPSPITHSTGLVTSVVLPMLVGAKSLLMEAWNPEEGLRLIEEHGCTAAVTATPFLQTLIGAYDADKHDPSSMRLWVCAGAPIPSSVVEHAHEALAGCRTLSLYGRSENFLTTMCTVDDPLERSAVSDGSAVAGAEVKVVDIDGNEVPRGEEGDIAYKGPSHMIEYFRDPEQTRALFTDEGFSRSGDLGKMDRDGFVRVTGRSKDIIIRGGMNLSALEIEDHLLGHPSIGSVAVVGMPDERLGERACAYVVLADGVESLELAELTGYLRERNIAVQKLPERLEVVPELPMTATGKIQKHVLRAEIAKKVS